MPFTTSGRLHRVSLRAVLCLLAVVPILAADAPAEDNFRPVALTSRVADVQPMTGIVLWTTNEAVETAPIQLEYSYFTYASVVAADGSFDWKPLEDVLDAVAKRKHQLVLRWHDTYVGMPTGVPAHIKRMPGYRETKGRSEKKATDFPDWSHPGWRQFVLDFFSEFSKRYDNDPRIAFVQVGFGLWSEYHIYDGPMKLGQTFPSLEFQTEFARHLAKTFVQTPWMISVDAAGEQAPYAASPELLDLRFGVFDDSFNHAKHAKENLPNWNTFRRDRWKTAPAGGEFSFFAKVDQTKALAPKGPHGIPFEKQAADFHISFMIGDDQPTFQKPARIREAGMACGYRFRVKKFEASADAARVEIENRGIAPIYYDAHPAIGGVRSKESLKGMLPGEKRTFEIAAGGTDPALTIECDRLVKGQRIGFDADLPR